MALFSFDDLVKPVTREEAQANIYAVLGILGVNTTAWGSGAVVRTMIVGVSAMMAALSTLQAKIAKSGFLDLSEKDWLTLVARYVYGVERIAATYASGACELHNSSGALYDLDAGEYLASNPTTGKIYRNVAAFSLGAGQTISVQFIAVEGGTASNAATNTITSPVSALLNVTITNTETFIGVDEESDPSLRTRCREKLGALSPMGPWDAYAYAAKNAKRSTGEAAGVTRTRVLKDGYGNLQLVVASSSGVVTGSIGDLTSALGAVDDAINKLAEPLSVNATAVSASALAVTVAYELWVYNRLGLTDAQIKTQVQAALATHFLSQPIGGAKVSPESPGYVYVDALRAVVGNAVPESFHAVITSPASDQVLTSTQVATLIHSPLAHATVHLVTPPEGV